MLSSGILDVAIGLVFVYFVMSLACSALNELLSRALRTRARYLKNGLLDMLRGANGATAVKESTEALGRLRNHPAIASLCKDDTYPSHLPSHAFSHALFGVVREIAEVSGSTLEDLRHALATPKAQELLGKGLCTAVLHLIQNAEDIEEAEGRVERWFDDAMDRVGGWYRRRAQQVIFALSIALTVAGNVDSISIARSLSIDAKSREQIALLAKEVVVRGREGKELKPDDVATMIAQADQLGLPLGWSTPLPKGRHQWGEHIVGLLFTALAVSLGAPFWFDMLNKLLGLKGGKEEKSDKEKSDKPEVTKPA
jgi:hypothetical protein